MPVVSLFGINNRKVLTIPYGVLVMADSTPCARRFTDTLRQAGYHVSVIRSIARDLQITASDAGYDIITAMKSTGASIQCIVPAGSPADEIESHALGVGFDLLPRKSFLPTICPASA